MELSMTIIFFVCMAWTIDTHPHDPTRAEIHTNFHNLFDLIREKDINKTKTLSQLEQQAVWEQREFDSMKGELQVARQNRVAKLKNLTFKQKRAAFKRETSKEEPRKPAKVPEDHTITKANCMAGVSTTFESNLRPSGVTNPIWKNIFHAIKRNNLVAVKQFVKQDSNVITSIDAEKKSGALLAAEFGYLPILKYFLEKNSTLLTVPDRSGNTVLGQAIQNGDLDMVRYLVEVCKADIFAIDQRIHTAVHVAAREGQLPILKYFVEERKCDVNAPNQNGEPPLFSAAEKPYIHVIAYLIEECHADPMITDLTKDNILYVSARQGDITVPQYLLDTKKIPIDVNWKNSLGYTILNWACRFNHTEFAKYIVERKNANVNLADTRKGRTPLHNAAARDNIELCKFLVKHGARPDVADLCSMTPELLASEPEVTDYLTKQTLAKSNRKRRSVIESISILPLQNQIPYQNVLPQYWILGNNQETATQHLTKSVIGVLDGLLAAVDITMKYIRGLSHQQVKGHQQLISPQEYIQYRMDPVAINAANGLFHFEE